MFQQAPTNVSSRTDQRSTPSPLPADEGIRKRIHTVDWLDKLILYPIVIALGMVLGLVWMAAQAIAWMAAAVGGVALLFAILSGSLRLALQAALCLGIFAAIKFGPLLFVSSDPRPVPAPARRRPF